MVLLLVRVSEWRLPLINRLLHVELLIFKFRNVIHLLLRQVSEPSHCRLIKFIDRSLRPELVKTLLNHQRCWFGTSLVFEWASGSLNQRKFPTPNILLVSVSSFEPQVSGRFRIVFCLFSLFILLKFNVLCDLTFPFEIVFWLLCWSSFIRRAFKFLLFLLFCQLSVVKCIRLSK